ncbi:MAG: protein kinase [Polyangiaceae bacterium]
MGGERGCVDDDELVALADARLSPEDRASLVSHAERCASCQALVGAILTEADGASDPNATVDERDRHEPRIPVERARYELGRTLGEGAMGRVVLAQDTRLDRPVALKLLVDESSGSVALEARLTREARAMAKLLHPNVVAVFDAGRLGDGRLFVAMEYVDGETLRQHVARAKPSREAIVRLYLAAARGLVAAHDLGLVHRDFKADNVLVSASGEVKVGDFGLVRNALGGAVREDAHDDEGPASHGLTRDGTILGTPAYMAPEQHEGRPADARADEFAFMASLYESLAGKRPYAGSSLAGLHDAKKTLPPPPTGDEALDTIVLRGLSPRPEDRYPDMREVALALESFLARAQAPTPPRARSPRAAVIAVLLAVASVSAYVVSRVDHEAPRDAPQTPSAAASRPRPARGLVAMLESAETRARIEAAYTSGKAPRGSAAATLTNLLAAAKDLEAADAAGPTPGESECLDLLAGDVHQLADEALKVSDRSTAEGLVRATVALERATFCRGASPDPGDATAPREPGPTFLRMRLGAPIGVSPPTPGRFDVPSKRGVLTSLAVLDVLHDDPDAFPDDGDFRAFDDVLGVVMDKVEQQVELQRKGADDIAQRALSDTFTRLDGGGARALPEIDRAVAAAETVALDVARARLEILRAEKATPDERARRLGDLMPLVRRIADARTSAKYATARLWLDALRGLSPVSGTLSTCAETKVGERQGCAPLLLVYGDLAVDRSAREVDLETATARELFGEGHPVYAESVVHAAEHALHHGDTDAALARAKEARAILEASLEDDAHVIHALSSWKRPSQEALPSTRAPFDPPLWTGIEAFRKYVHLARAIAVEVRALPKAEAQAALVEGRDLRGRGRDDAVLLPIELAAVARFGGPRPGFDLAKAERGLGHPAASARTFAWLARSEPDEKKARGLFAKALEGVALLPPHERAQLRFEAAAHVQDKTVARALLERALVDASPTDKPRIEAKLRTVPDTPSVHGSRP